METVLQKDREAALLQAEQGKLTAQKAALAPWLSLDLPLESGSTREMLVQFGTLTAARPLEEAQQAVERASELAQLIQASARCATACSSATRAPRRRSWRPWELRLVQSPIEWLGWPAPDRAGWTARENDARLDRELRRRWTPTPG